MKYLLTLLLLGFTSTVHAQDRPNPMESVERFFQAFHAKDSLGMQQLMSPKARLLRSTFKNGQAIVQENDLNRFIQAVATRKDSPKWEERLGQPIVQQHLNLATVWLPFRFYLDNTLSHCGYNAFSLAWNGQSWQILSLIDTGTKDCDSL